MSAVATLTRVHELRTEGPYLVLSIEAPDIAAQARPGQFAMIAQEASCLLLRRPFSIMGAEDGRIEIGFDAVGPGTRWIASRRPGAELDVIGPLGTAFEPLSEGSALLVGGGYGAAPLFFLSRVLRAAGVRTTLILGAATKARLFCPERAVAAADEVMITTEDGSEGLRGRVTDAMMGVHADRVYACGPMPMLAAVSAAAGSVRCEVAVEEFMGCGIGVCFTCVVPTKQDGYRRHIRSCIEGPVLEGASIAW